MSKNLTNAEKQAARLKNVRISHKKAAEFGITLDLSALVNRALTEADQCKPNDAGEVKSYNLASTGGFINLTAPGFENVQISVNVITSKSKYDATVAAENAAKAQASAPAPATSAPAGTDLAALMAVIQLQNEQMAALQAQVMELAKPKTRKRANAQA